MEIKTHVLTTEQHLDLKRKERARKNIEAIGKITVNGEDVTPAEYKDSVDLSRYTVPTPSTANKVLTSGEDGTFGWSDSQAPNKFLVDASTAGDTLTIQKSDGTSFQFKGQENVIESVSVNGEPQPVDGSKNVNIQIASPVQPYNDVPEMNGGEGSSGSILAYAKGDHVHPSDTTKVDKVEGKGLSTNDYTTAEKEKLGGIAANATKTEASANNGQIKINGTDTTVYTHPAYTAANAAPKTVGCDATGHVVLGESLTKNDVGLDQVDNTSDLNKPISTATQTALDQKVDKVSGKGLSENDFTDEYKDKLDGISAHATKTEASSVNGNIKVDGQDVTVYTHPVVTPVQAAAVEVGYDSNGHVVIGDPLTKSTFGLGNVDNTSDLDKPISTATQSALDQKLNKVSGATEDHIASFDDNGSLKDSGKTVADFKPIQTAVTDPTAIGTSTSFIDSISQDANGVITATKKTVPSASTSQAGISQLSNAIDSTSEAEAATPKAVKLAYDLANGKQDPLAIADNYNAETNKVATQTTVSNAVAAAVDDLDATVDSTAGTGITDTNVGIRVVETNGKITDVVVTKDDTETKNNKVSAFQGTPDDTHYPTEKLVKDGLDGKLNKVTGATENNFAAFDVGGVLKDSGSKASDFKTKQTAVVSPTSSGETDSFIDSISQNANGEITATKKAVQTVIAEGTSGARNGLITKESQAKLDGIASGAQVNVLEGVKVAGTELEIVNKKVNIPLATVPSQGVNGIPGVVNLTDNLDSQDPNAAITPSAVAAALRAQAKFFDNQADWDAYVLDHSVGDPSITYYVQVGSGADQYDVYRWKVPEGAEPGSYEKVDEASISLDGYWHDGPTVSGEGNVVTAISVAATGVPQVTKGLTVGNGTLTMTVGSANAKTFSANQTANETLTIPLAASASGATAATEGLMSSADKEKLDTINDAEYKNKIDAVKVNGSALAIDSLDKSVNIPLASYTTGATPTYEDGVVSGQDKKKIDDAIQGVKLEGATDPIVPSNDRVVTIPNAVPTGTGETNGLLTAADKAKLDSFASVNDTTITIDVGGAASGESNPVAGDFTTNQDTTETITIPAAQSAIPAVPAVVDPITGEITTPAQEAVPAQPGVMSAADKDKLDSLKIFKRIQITNNGSTVANIDADDAADTVMFDTGKGMDIMQVGANSDKILFETTVNNFDRVKVSDGATPTPRVVDVAADDVNQALTLVAGDNITLTPDTTNKKITIDAAGATSTVSEGTGITVTPTTDPQTGITDYNVAVTADLGYLYGQSTVNNPTNGADLLTTSMTGLSTSGNDRFIIAEDDTDHHVYLYALKSLAGLTPADDVHGVDLFTLNVNARVYRNTTNGYYYLASMVVIGSGSQPATYAEAVETWPSQIGEQTVNISVTIKNSTGTVTTIDGKEYYGYRLLWTGDVVTGVSPDIMGVVTYVSVLEETTGIVEVGSGGGSTYAAGDAIDLANDAISVKYGSGLGLNASNELEVKIGDGLKYDTTGGVTFIALDSVTEAVVQAVQKLSRDLDTKLTTNFDIPNVDNTYDFASSTVTGMSDGAVMLCQAFTVPINNNIRLETFGTNPQEPTLLGVYAKQNFASDRPVMFALYEYDFDTNRTDYVADTGPVTIVAGRNEFPILHKNPNINELKSSCIYYASLYLPSASNHGGLLLAGCSANGYQQNINAVPRFSIRVQNITYNGSEIKMNAANGRLDYKDSNDNYYIGPWTNSYNEIATAPRFFMQIRNAGSSDVISTEPFDDLTSSYTLTSLNSINDVFGSNPQPNGDDVVFQGVTPRRAVIIKSWTFYDMCATDTNGWGKRVYDSGFDTMVSDPSQITVSEGSVSGMTGVYYHTYTSQIGIALSANTKYQFPAGMEYDTSSHTDYLIQYATPSTVKKDLVLFDNGANVSQNALALRALDVAGGAFLQLVDSNDRTWII